MITAQLAWLYTKVQWEIHVESFWRTDTLELFWMYVTTMHPRPLEERKGTIELMGSWRASGHVLRWSPDLTSWGDLGELGLKHICSTGWNGFFICEQHNPLVHYADQVLVWMRGETPGHEYRRNCLSSPTAIQYIPPRTCPTYMWYIQFTNI